MGRVFRARQTDLDRIVALKGLQAVAANDEFAARFARESRLAGARSHPNIVTVFEYLEHDGTPYIAMEYVARGSLRPWLGHLSIAQLAGVLEGLLEALSAVAPLGIVHRDIKPENVLVTDEGRVKITDFGIAKATERERFTELQTRTSVTMGTPAYMAPEQADTGLVDARADLYSVGILAYEQLVGHVPFHETKGAVAMLMRHIKEPVPSVLDSIPELDPTLAAWIARLVERDPAARPATARDAWDELEEIVLNLLGARWRRESRLSDREPAGRATRLAVTRALHSQRIDLPLDTRAGEDQVGIPDTAELERLLETPTSTFPPDDAEITRERIVPLDRRVSPPGSSAPQGPETNFRPEVAHAAKRRRRRVQPIAATVLGMLVLGGVGTAVGATLAQGGRHTPRPLPLTGSASTQMLQLSFPAGWERAAAAGSGGTSSESALRLAATRTGASLEVAFAESKSPTLLSSSILRSLPRTPQPASASLGGRIYYRYLALAPKGSGDRVSVYALPTDSGVLLATCSLPKGGALAVNVECERILSSLELASARAMTPGPQRKYAGELDAALSNIAGAPARSGLGKKNTAGGQAEALRRIAASTAAALGALRDAQPGPAEADAAFAIRTAVAQMHDGYDAMAGAAAAEDEGRYLRARRQVSQAGDALQRAVRRLRPFGYT
jgi:serine/threonine protein kinase